MKFTCLKKDKITAITENATQKLFKLNCLLADLNLSNHYSETLKLFSQIHSSNHLKLDHYTLSTTLTASANLHSTVFGSQLHAHAIRTGLKPYPHVSNTLLSLYAKSEDLVSVKRVFGEIQNPDVYSWTTLLSACTKLRQFGYALQVFDQMPHRNVAVWNAIITGCAENGHADIAFDSFQRMHKSVVRHDNYTFASVLSLCFPESLDFGRQVHSLVIKTGFLARASVINAQLTMYFNFGNVSDAYEVFEEAKGRVHDEITYNAMIAGLVSIGRDEEALVMFREMQEVCLRPTELTFVSIMSSCSCLTVGRQVHSQAIKKGFETCTSVSNAATTMYSKCGDIDTARVIFERLEEKDLVSWNTMITSYAQGNMARAAISTYVEMRREGTEHDEFTIGSLLASSESLVTIEMIQAVVLKTVLFLKIQVLNALVSAFSKHGEIYKAYQIFSEISLKNLISWNTIISGFLLNGFPQQSFEKFAEMVVSGLGPNVYTLTIVLSACAHISALRHGKQVHSYILKFGFFSETPLGNALITLYAKCGVLDWSLRVFNMIINKDTVSWNSMISAFSQHGKGKKAVDYFQAMQDSGGTQPDQATFTAVLSACSHSGLVEDGIRVFNSMVNKYGFVPGVDQFSCIVDLLGRAGYIDEAERFISNKYVEVDSSIWWTLFSSCAAHANLRLGRIVAGILLESEKDNAAFYVLLANIYADMGQWDEAANVRKLMKRCGVMKQPGYSWIGS